MTTPTPTPTPEDAPREDPTAALLAARERVRGFARRHAPPGVDPEDLAQDLLARLLAHAHEVPPGRAEAWALTTARRALVDLLRRRRPAALGDVEPAAPVAEEDATDLAACVRPLLGALAPEDRAVLEDVDAAGRSQTALARALGVSASTLKSRVQRARQRLRALLERCCDVELDRRGAPLDARRRGDDACGRC